MMKAMKIETSHIKERMDIRDDEEFQIFSILHSFFKYFFSWRETLTFCVIRNNWREIIQFSEKNFVSYWDY